MDFHRIFKKKYTLEELNIFRFLSKVPAFELLKPDEMELFLPYLHERQFQKGEVIFFRTDPAKAFYVIKNGKVQINIDINNEFEPLRTFKTGESFGASGFLANDHRIYNAIADAEDCMIYVLPQVNALEIMEANPKICAKIMTSVSNIFSRQMTNIFKAYKESPGIFILGEAYTEE